MITNNRTDYSSADEWLEALKQDDAWLGKLQKLQESTTAELNRERDIAHKKMGDYLLFGHWDTYNHNVLKVVQELWDAGLSLSNLKNKTIGMLTLEYLKQKTETSNNGILLPKELDTPKARKAFEKAIELKYMEATYDGKYHWIGTCKKPNTSELAYFLGKVYNCKPTLYGNKGEAFPEESLNKLFGVTRLYSSLTQVYNAKRKQRWRSLINEIFE